MRFLEKLGFTNADVKKFCDNTADVMLSELHENKKLVRANVQYLMDLGVKNIHDIFFEYYELFLMDYSNFTGIFSKYDREDLIEKLEKNIAIVEYL